jgi:sulfite reductase beta subunit-like hemoprotein
MDYTAVWDTTNLAARLQRMAQQRSVAISEAPHQCAPHALAIIGLIGLNSHVCTDAHMHMRDRSLVHKITDIVADLSTFTLVQMCTRSLAHKFTPSHTDVVE